MERADWVAAKADCDRVDTVAEVLNDMIVAAIESKDLKRWRDCEAEQAKLTHCCVMWASVERDQVEAFDRYIAAWNRHAQAIGLRPGGRSR